MARTIAEFVEVSKVYCDGEDNHPVLNDVSLSMKTNDTIALTGPSGSGKSTLLNLLVGFDNQTNGKIYLTGKNTQHW